MRKLLPILPTLAFLLCATEGWSADFEKGWYSYVRGDYSSALREWPPLAEQGNAIAKLMLGEMYDFGRGVPKVYVEAHKWLNLTAENGNDLGAQLRDLLEKRMNPSMIGEAQILARECVKNNYKGC